MGVKIHQARDDNAARYIKQVSRPGAKAAGWSNLSNTSLLN
jgi:hypothetical protein